MEKAYKIEDVYDAVIDKALTIDEINTFYCETDAVRGPLPARFKLANSIRRNANSGRDAHILFVGYRGCGKSTELNHLQKDLQKEYAIINYSVSRELDPQSINYIELFIVTMERLFNFVIKKDLAINEDFLERIKNWTQTKEIKEIKDKHFSLEASAGMNTGAKIPYLFDFFLKLKGAAKTSNSFKETLTNTLEPRLSDLIQYCNDLIQEIRIQLLTSTNYADLVIFIEDLDKIPLEQAKSLFYNYANQLTLLRATVIYTFPVTLYYSTYFGVMRAYFSDTIELPMIKIAEKNGTDFNEGIDALKEIINRRMDSSLFSGNLLLPQMIKKTGGVIRDLLILINDAADMALSQNKQAIDDQCFTYAYNQLKKEYNNTIADYSENGVIKFTAADQYRLMADLVNDDKKIPDNSEMMMLLRQNLCVLSYNGEGWCDVHPAMKDVLKDKGYL